MAAIRKIASIQKISMILKSISSNYEQAQINGWNFFIKSNTFVIGQTVVYLEIDAFISNELFEKIKDYIPISTSLEQIENGFFINTIKFDSSVSQGLALPLTLFDGLDDLALGTDVSKQIGVVKYDDETRGPINVSDAVFPIWIPKSDQMRIQNFVVLPEYKSLEFEVTQKLDGTSITVYYKNDNVYICSRNNIVSVYDGSSFISKSNPGFPMEEVVRKSGLAEKLFKTKRKVAIQAELTGPGIQQKATPKLQMSVYDVYDDHMYMTPDDRLAFIEQFTNEYIVPIPIIKRRFKVFEELVTPENMLKFANSVYQKEKCEGVVFKTENPARLSFKAVSNEYLLETARLAKERKELKNKKKN